MKKILIMFLALAMCVSIAACAGGTSGNGESTGGQEATEAPAESAVVVPDDYTEINVKNNCYGMSAKVYAPPVDGTEWEVKKEEYDELASHFEAYYRFEDKKYVDVELYLQPATADRKEELLTKEGFSAVDNANGYEGSMEIKEATGNGYDSSIYLFGDPIIDGFEYLSIRCRFINSAMSEDDFTALVTNIAKYATIEPSDGSALVTENGELKYPGYDMYITPTVTISGSECKIDTKLSSVKLQYRTNFDYDGVSYKLYTNDILPLSSFESFGDKHEPIDCQIAERDAKLYVDMAYGALEGQCLVKLDDENYLRIVIGGEGYLDGESLADGVSLSEYSKSMLTDGNRDATYELFRGFFDDFVSAITINS